jgi:hypothetical protein
MLFRRSLLIALALALPPSAAQAQNYPDRPAVAERFEKSGARLVGNAPAEIAAQIRAERVRWGEIIKAAGIKAE